MTDLATVELDTFTPLVGETFRLPTQTGGMDLVLHEAKALGDGIRKGGAFSLLFRGPEDTVLAQQLTAIRHASFGELELFLVPVGPLGEGMGYEAVFT